MLVWAIYDISDDRKRARLARRLKDAGIYRVQKSAFVGNLDRNRIDELALSCRSLVDSETDALYVIPMCETDFRYTLSLGRALDKQLVSDEVLGVVL